MSEPKFVSPEDQRRNNAKVKTERNQAIVARKRKPAEDTELPRLMLKAVPSGEPAEVIDLTARKRKEPNAEASTDRSSVSSRD